MIKDIIRQKYQQKWMYDKNEIEIVRYKYTHQRLTIHVGISLFINIQTFANTKCRHMGVRKIFHFVSEKGGVVL